MYLYAESASLISMVSIARKYIGAVPISKCKFMYLPRLGDTILQILQFEMAWQMLFFMPFQKYVVFFFCSNNDLCLGVCRIQVWMQ